MSPNFFTELKNGKIYNYADLKTVWDATKNNPKDSNYGFLSSIFGMDNSKATYSESIFKQISESDKEEGLSFKDINNLADRGSGRSSIITEGQFERIYGYDMWKVSNDPFEKVEPSEDFKVALEAVNPNPFYVIENGEVLPENEAKIARQNQVNRAKQRIIDYAKQNPEDLKIQKYAELLGNTEIKIERPLLNQNTIYPYKVYDTKIGGMYDIDENGKGSIKIPYGTDPEFGDDKVVTAILLHELGHSEDGDNLDSKAEETAVERYAIETAAKIHGVKQIHDEDNVTYLKNFIQNYSDYPDNSPGHGLPDGLGLTLDGKITGIEKNPDGYVITSKEDGHTTRTLKVEYKDGYPTRARTDYISINGDHSFKYFDVYNNYDPKSKKFLKGYRSFSS